MDEFKSIETDHVVMGVCKNDTSQHIIGKVCFVVLGFFLFGWFFLKLIVFIIELCSKVVLTPWTWLLLLGLISVFVPASASS